MDPIDLATSISALLLELILLFFAISFYRAMKKSGALLWTNFGLYMSALAASLFIGQFFVFLALFIFKDHLQIMLLIGDLFWLIAAIFGLLMVLEVSKKIKEVLG
jgi:hypothetical protein